MVRTGEIQSSVRNHWQETITIENQKLSEKRKAAAQNGIDNPLAAIMIQALD
jgi:hypothetical protein